MSDGGRTFLDAALPHLDAVYRVARNMTRSHHEAEDLVQETYMRAFAAFRSHHGPSTKAWLVTICLNLARSEGRRRMRHPSDPVPPEQHEAIASGAVSVPDEALANIDGERVRRALAQIPEEQRVAIVLMDLAGHSASEVAKMLDCSRNTVLSRAYRGRQRLASLLVKEGANRDLP